MKIVITLMAFVFAGFLFFAPFGVAAYAGGSGSGAAFQRNPDGANKWEAWKAREKAVSGAHARNAVPPIKKNHAL